MTRKCAVGDGERAGVPVQDGVDSCASKLWMVTRSGPCCARIAAAITVPKLTGKGVGASIIGAIAVVFLHELLDAPVAKAMVNAGIQF